MSKVEPKYALTPDNPYVIAWSRALKGLLGWTPEQVHEGIVKNWQEYMEKCDDAQGGMFYHEGPNYYLEGVLLYEWRHEAPEHLRRYTEDRSDFGIDLAASQESEIMYPLVEAYPMLDWLHVHDDEQPPEPNWAEVAAKIKANIRAMPPFEEWKKLRFGDQT